MYRKMISKSMVDNYIKNIIDKMREMRNSNICDTSNYRASISHDCIRGEGFIKGKYAVLVRDACIQKYGKLFISGSGNVGL